MNVPAVAPEDLEALGPFLPLAIQLGRIAVGLADGLNSLHVEYLGRVAERDTRLLTVQVLKGVPVRPRRGGRERRQRARRWPRSAAS